MVTKRKAIPRSGTAAEIQEILRWHRLHLGVYARVAKRIGVDPSYVSRVANGTRHSDKVEKALVFELRSLYDRWPGVPKKVLP